MDDVNELSPEEEAAVAAADRAKKVAAMSLDVLLDVASDAELAAEAARCGRARSRISTRGVAVSHKAALASLDDGLAALPRLIEKYHDAIRDDVRKRLPVRPSTLVDLLKATDALARRDELQNLAAKALEPDGQTITKTDEKAPKIKEWRRLDERSAEIGVELNRREVARQMEALPPRKNRKKAA